MKITPISKCGDSRQGTLNNVTVKRINEVLGFSPNVKDDPYKVKYSWGFMAGKDRCGIWDYKGSHSIGSFSTFGPASVFKELFGDSFSA